MYKNKTFLGIIPARGGSKRLPEKNILNLHGKPLLVWTIEAALKTQYLDKIVVSSDDDKILDIVHKFKVHALKRPVELASDNATSFDTVKHVLDRLKKYNYVVLLQPTSPLRNEKHIDKAIALLEEKDADAVISVCEINHNPMWINTLNDSLSMQDFLNNRTFNKKNQDSEKYYRLNGAIYICKTDKLIEEKGFFLRENIYAFKMDKESSIDIDEQIDFQLAETLLGTMFD